ncbi:MAG: glycosyltransferase, partial [Oligoflexales bacterium]|nr:glycosyltransferase [Oligoflexales bacterium]
MKILHIGKFYYPSKGGIETVLKNLAEEQVRKGQQVTVLCFGNKGEEAVQDIEGVKVIRSGVFCTLFSQPLSFSLAFRIRNLVKSHDLIHVHLPNPLAEFILTCLLITKPIIVSYHSDVVRQKLIYIFYKPFQMLFLRKVSKIVTATQAQIRFSKTLSNFPSKCTVVPYGVTLKEYVLTEKISAQAVELKKKFGPYCLFVGRLVSYKGLEFLLEAMADAPLNLVVVGDGPLRSRLEDLAKSKTKNIYFVGQVPGREQLFAYYEGCEIFILPSISVAEQFGMVMMEAIASPPGMVAS